MKTDDSSKVAPYLSLTVFDLMMSMYHAYLAAAHPSIGFNDANRTLDDFIKFALERPVKMRVEDFEAALYNMNLADEVNQFWHPRGYSFDRYVRTTLETKTTGLSFDKKYNLIRGKK